MVPMVLTVILALCSFTAEGPAADQPRPGQPEASRAVPHAAEAMNINIRDVKWQRMLPELAERSPEIAILRVDPKTQATQLLIRTPAAIHIPMHWHSANETHTLLAGTATFECGGKRATLGPGSFNYMPAKEHHQAWSSAGGMVFITVDGAWDVNWVNGPPTASDLLGKAEHVVLGPADLKWQPAPPALPPGAQVAMLEGDPTAAGPFTMRVKIPANYQVPPHWHPADEHVTVISGSFHVAMGDHFDKSNGKEAPAGGFALMPAGTHHFAWTTEETVIQVHATGPWAINYVNPADDPRK